MRPFTDREINLLRTFGDQAAIALEDVRLFNETNEALEQQRASGDVLTAISSSPLPVAPFLHVKVPVVSLSRTLFFGSHARLDSSTLPLPSTSICSTQDGELAGVDTFTRALPTLVVLVALAGGGIVAFFCTCAGLTCNPADES